MPLPPPRSRCGLALCLRRAAWVAGPGLSVGLSRAVRLWAGASGAADADGVRAPRMPTRAWLTALAGFVVVSAWGGAVALITGWLRPGTSMAQRLPFHSPVFAGLALACIVAVPTTVVAVLAWRHHPRDRDAAALAGVLLVGWIVVEVAVIRQFSALQVVYGLAGVGLITGGYPLPDRGLPAQPGRGRRLCRCLVRTGRPGGRAVGRTAAPYRNAGDRRSGLRLPL